MVTMLYLSTWLAPVITKVFELAQYNVGTSELVTSVNCGVWPVALFTLVLQSIGWIGLVIIGVIALGLLIYVNKIRKTIAE